MTTTTTTTTNHEREERLLGEWIDACLRREGTSKLQALDLLCPSTKRSILFSHCALVAQAQDEPLDAKVLAKEIFECARRDLEGSTRVTKSASYEVHACFADRSSASTPFSDEIHEIHLSAHLSTPYARSDEAILADLDKESKNNDHCGDTRDLFAEAATRIRAFQAIASLEAPAGADKRRNKDIMWLAAPPEVSLGLVFLLTHIGSWTNARWDQHLRERLGDGYAASVIRWLAERGIRPHIPEGLSGRRLQEETPTVHKPEERLTEAEGGHRFRAIEALETDSPETPVGKLGRRARVHDLKTWPEFFQGVWESKKRFEVRHDDRGFEASDMLLLREYDEASERYSGRAVLAIVTYIIHGGVFGLSPHTCVMSIDAIDSTERYEPGVFNRSITQTRTNDADHCFKAPYCTLHDCACRCEGCLPHSDPTAVKLQQAQAEIEMLRDDADRRIAELLVANASPRQRWEYETLCLDAEDDADQEKAAMNKLGAEGWELVSTFRLSDDGTYLFFKRSVL